MIFAHFALEGSHEAKHEKVVPRRVPQIPSTPTAKNWSQFSLAMSDGEILRNYVLGGEESKQIGPEGQIRLDVISEVLNGSPSNSSNNWKNFPATMTIPQFKAKVF